MQLCNSYQPDNIIEENIASNKITQHNSPIHNHLHELLESNQIDQNIHIKHNTIKTIKDEFINTINYNSVSDVSE